MLKNKLWAVLLALALVLSFTLAACNEKTAVEGGATVDANGNIKLPVTIIDRPASATTAAVSSEDDKDADSDQLIYTISFINRTTKETFSASCGYSNEEKNIASASLSLPGGDYEVAVYEYGHSEIDDYPLVVGSYNNSIDKSDHKVLTVTYNADTYEITLKEN